MALKLLYVLSSVAVLIFAVFYFNFAAEKTHPYAGYNIVQLAEAYGYTMETYTVETQDGYLLGLHRLLKTNNTNKSLLKGPILLAHGTTQSAVDYLVLGRSSLAVMLLEGGYDVWLMNARGTTWSKKHKHLCPKKNASDFWNFSFQEIGAHDVPSVIDYVLNKTQRERLQYIGFSSGGSTFFIMLSERPEYNNKVKMMVALSPGVYINDAKSLLPRFLRYYWNTSESIIRKIWPYEFGSSDGLAAKYFRFICGRGKLLMPLCRASQYLLEGRAYGYDESLFPVIYTNMPGGASTKQICHCFQLSISGQFHNYDYGEPSNVDIYGQNKPPLYDLSRVQVPVTLFGAKSDWIVSEQAIERLKNDLPSAKKFIIKDDFFNHNDFMYHKKADVLLYRYIFQDVEKYL